jgi:polyisoprenoid-binding protein YceI
LDRPARLLAPLALALAGIGAILTPVSAQEASPTPSPGVLETPAAEINCNTEGENVSEIVAQVASVYAIVPEESEARYRAQEELQGIGANEAVGTTQAIAGTILFDAAGMPLACSRFDVDLRTLVSDESRRDNFLRRNTLETDAYPLATFVVTAVAGLDQALVDGEETTFTLVGNLTVRDVTRLVAWEATVTKNGDTIAGNAHTGFAMPDYGIEPPIVGSVLSIEETIVLEIDVTATRAV